MSTKTVLEQLTRDEAREALPKAVLLVPVATIEQHGAHAPLHTDTSNVWAICCGVAEQVNPNPRVLVAPLVWFSPSPFDSAHLPVSINIREDVFCEALNDILETYLRAGFKRIVVINGHGGGTEHMIPSVIRKLNRKVSSVWPDWRIPDDAQVVGFAWFPFLATYALDELRAIRPTGPVGDEAVAKGEKTPLGADWHAGDMETALQLHLNPELVDTERAKSGAMPKPELNEFAPVDLAESWQRQYIIEGYGALREAGEEPAIAGDPTLATPELGARLLDLAVTKIGEFVRELAARSSR